MSGLFAKKQNVTNTATRIGALRVQSSSQGVPIPIVYGATRVSPNLIWYGDFTAIAHTDTQQSGGKGGGGSTVTNTTYTYQVALIYGICEGPIGGDSNIFGKVWQDKDVKFVDAADSPYTQFNGQQGQSPWSYLTTNHPSQAIGYSQTVLVAAEAFPLGDSDGLPNTTFEVIGFLTGSIQDVNIAHVLYDFLTSTQYGAGWSTEQLPNPLVDTRWSDYCAEMSFFASPAYVEQRPASDVVSELTRIGNAAPVWSEGQLKIIPYADSNVGSFVPDLTVQYNLGYGDFIAPQGTDPVRVHRKRPADAFNIVQVECLNRDNDYNIYVAEAKDQASIDLYGPRPMEPLVLHAICNILTARDVAQTILQRELYVRNTYEFDVGYRYARLEPMDIVSITDPLLGLNGLVVRIIGIEESDDFVLRILAEDLTIGVSTPGVYDTQDSGGYVVNNNVDPGNANAPVIFQPPIELSVTPQIWIGASGGANWGGAQIWASDDDSSYAMVGTIDSPSRYGVLTANFPAGPDPDTINTLSIDLSISDGVITSATDAQADAGDSLSYIGTATGGEIIDYSDVSLTGPFTYNLTTYIRRGQRCTLSTNHEAGENFLRLDASVAQIDIQESRVGQTLYIKLLSYNLTGGGIQELGAVTAIAYVVQPIGIVPVAGTVPDIISAQQVLCIPPGTQYSVHGRMTCAGRINCDGRLIIQ